MGKFFKVIFSFYSIVKNPYQLWLSYIMVFSINILTSIILNSFNFVSPNKVFPWKINLIMQYRPLLMTFQTASFCTTKCYVLTSILRVLQYNDEKIYVVYSSVYAFIILYHDFIYFENAFKGCQCFVANFFHLS